MQIKFQITKKIQIFFEIWVWELPKPCDEHLINPWKNSPIQDIRHDAGIHMSKLMTTTVPTRLS